MNEQNPYTNSNDSANAADIRNNLTRAGLSKRQINKAVNLYYRDLSLVNKGETHAIQRAYKSVNSTTFGMVQRAAVAVRQAYRASVLDQEGANALELRDKLTKSGIGRIKTANAMRRYYTTRETAGETRAHELAAADVKLHSM